MEKFEGQFVGYIMNQAAMPFFRVGCYDHHKVEDGRLVIDRSDETKKFKAWAREGLDLVNKIQEKHKRGKTIPKIWVARLELYSTLVDVLFQERAIVEEWHQQYHRLIRYLNA